MSCLQVILASINFWTPSGPIRESGGEREQRDQKQEVIIYTSRLNNKTTSYLGVGIPKNDINNNIIIIVFTVDFCLVPVWNLVH